MSYLSWSERSCLFFSMYLRASWAYLGALVAKFSTWVTTGGITSTPIPMGTASSPRYMIRMANPRRMWRLSKFTGPDRATAMNAAITSHPIGLRSR